MSLVQIPWQPYYWLRPETLTLLDRASDRVGHRLILFHSDPRGLLSAWRSYEQQKELYEAGLAGGVPASNPDYGQRSHMRGAAFDLIEQSAIVQNACRAVGLIRDPIETWHWNHPNWASMPVIKTNTALASFNISILEELMSAGGAVFTDNSTGYKVGYRINPIDPAAPDAPRIEVLGTASSPAWKVWSKGVKWTALSHAEVKVMAERYGVCPVPASLKAKLPVGAIGA